MNRERSDSSPAHGDRKRVRFSLRRVFVCTAAVASLAAIAAAFPQIALSVLIVVCVACLVGARFVAMLAEGIFEDWLASKLNSDGDTSDKPNDQ